MLNTYVKETSEMCCFVQTNLTYGSYQHKTNNNKNTAFLNHSAALVNSRLVTGTGFFLYWHGMQQSDIIHRHWSDIHNLTYVRCCSGFFSFQRNYSLHDSINVCRYIISNDIYFNLKFLFQGRMGKNSSHCRGDQKRKNLKVKKIT